MNNPINTPQSPNELVLRLIGGKLDGQLFTVHNEKCLLSDLSPDIENPEDHRCVIFRGEKGVAFRSYSDHVLCNGAKVSVQWLKKGDLIKLTDNFSVEVYQLGVYTNKTTPTPASRQPVQTVAIPNTDSTSSLEAPVVARPISTTVTTDSNAPVAPPTTGAASATPAKDYAKPSVQSPSVSPLPTGEAPKFKPATANLRTPSVTAPLPTHQVPTETPASLPTHQVPNETPAPVPSVSRIPVATQNLNVEPLATDTLPSGGAANPSLQTQSSPDAPATIPTVGIPSTPSNSTIDSLSERLSKLVDSAGTDGESGSGDGTSTPAATSTRASVSTMPIEPTPIAHTDKNPEATSEAGAEQSAAVVQPDQPSASPAEVESAAQRRAALENYFSKSGVSLAAPAPPTPPKPPTPTEDNDAPPEKANGDQGSQLESFALLQSLGLDTSGLGQIKKELAEAPREEEVQSISPNAEQQTEVQASEPQTSEPEKVESVADVLARMQNAGSLQDFNAGEAEAESSAVDTAQREAPPPAATPAAAMGAIPSGEQGSGGEDDSSVEDYMSQLLNRMRGDNEPTSGEVAEQKQDKAVEKIAAEQQLVGSAPVSQTQPEKVDKLTPEEFIPKQKAVRMQSLDSLREIANSNAREAFRDSLARERKVSTQTKLTLSMVSLAFAVLFVLMSYIGEKVNFWGVVFGIGFLIVGLLTARAYLSERKMDESILSD